MSATLQPIKGKRSVAMIGAGNIGSQLLGHLARMPIFGRIICVDPDTYSAGNRTAQEIDDSDINVSKATAMARRVRNIQPGIEVIPIVDRVENVPWGQLRADLICGCVDSKASRAAINLIARRLGIIYIDAGIRADGLLARVDVYGPEETDACIECGFGRADYEAMGRIYSCTGEFREAPSTGASSALGGLAAALQAIECAKVLENNPAHPCFGRQIVIESESHHLLVNKLRRNPQCRCDHTRRRIERVTASNLDDLAAAGASQWGGASSAAYVESKSWVTRLVCRGCGEGASTLALQGRISGRLSKCPRCGDQRQAVGFGMLPRLEIAALTPRQRTMSLARVGLRAGDVVSLSNGNLKKMCLELCGDGFEREELQ
jgi:adenylyltransferase/sulfurtransferase